MKHSYSVTCQCPRCTRERARRAAQVRRDDLNTRHRAFYDQPVRQSRRPVPGSQEWAETRGDDLGESPDY